MMTNQFSPKITEVLNYSKEEAIRLHNDTIRPEHLLLGLLRDGDCKAIQLLRLLTVDLTSIREQLEESVHEFIVATEIHQDDILLSEKTSKIMRLCLLEARLMKAGVADTEHILLAIMKEKDNNACRILETQHIHYADVINLLTQKTEKTEPTMMMTIMIIRHQTMHHVNNRRTKPRHPRHQITASLLTTRPCWTISVQI